MIPAAAPSPTSPGDLRRITGGGMTAAIADPGAELQALHLADGRPLLWHGDAAFWTGRAPLLFPIVGRAPEDRIAVDGQVAPMAQHGFARRSLFACTGQGPDFCRHDLTDTAETRAVYPRAFRLTVTHGLSAAGLRVEAVVINSGDRDLPFGFGFHPAFLWPLPGAEGRPHHVTLANGAEPLRVALDQGLIAPGHLPSPFRAGRLDLTPELFAQNALVFPQGAGTALSYGAEGGPDLQFTFENLPFLALWQPPGAPFLCIEPWQGMAARRGDGPEIADRPGSVILPPGQSRRFAVTLRVQG